MARANKSCGNPGQPPCPKENFKRHVGTDKQLTESYRDEMLKKSDSFVDVLKSKNQYKLAGNVHRAVQLENEKRLKSVQETPAYKAMSKNKAVKSTGVGRTVKEYEDQIKRGSNPYELQIPKASEIKKIRSFGLENSSSDNIYKAAAKSPSKAAGAYFEMKKVLKDYPNLNKIKQREGKKIKKK